jgi:cyanophycinase
MSYLLIMAQRLLFAIVLATSASSATAATGQLIIVGGALDPANEAIYSVLLDARPDDAPTVAIISAASGEPIQSAERFASDLVRHGLDRNDISIVRLALIDDPETLDVDESEWAGNASNQSEIAKIQAAGAIWFTGGDQARIVRALHHTNGAETPMLAAISERHAKGAAIGGTSAGAAIMSEMMILEGDTPGSLLPEGRGEQLVMGPGLGFMQQGLVDQHFGQRARLGRLALALGMAPYNQRIGFGIDENTALVVNPDMRTARVEGAGYVTILDARHAKFDIGKRIAISDVSLGIASQGDTISLADGQITPAAYKRSTFDREYFDRPSLPAGGIAISGYALDEIIGEGLIDNKGARQVERTSFVGEDGITYLFTQVKASKGWWGKGPNLKASYAVTAVKFDIVPVRITLKQVGVK